MPYPFEGDGTKGKRESACVCVCVCCVCVYGSFTSHFGNETCTSNHQRFLLSYRCFDIAWWPAVASSRLVQYQPVCTTDTVTPCLYHWGQMWWDIVMPGGRGLQDESEWLSHHPWNRNKTFVAFVRMMPTTRIRLRRVEYYLVQQELGLRKIRPFLVGMHTNR